MSPRLHPTQSRLLAVLLLVVLIGGVVGGLGVPLWRAYRANEHTIAEYRHHLAQFQRIAAGRAAFERRVRLLEQRNDLKRYLLGEESMTLAAAGIREKVKDAVQEHGGSLTSTRVLEAVDEGPFRRVTVNVRMSVTIQAMQMVLHALESQLPYLVLDNLSIRRSARLRRGRKRSFIRNLDVHFDVSGFLLRPMP